MFIDTSGLLCCFDTDEARHQAAIQCYDATRTRLTHNYVLAEFVALAQARQYPRELSLELIAEVQADSTIDIVWVDQTLHNNALSLLQSQLDKTYSLCDAVSFVLMRERGILDALTTDRHFEQAGFRRLLSS